MANEQYQPISVNPGSSQQAIQSTQIVTPALQDLMTGITSGMISLGDLQRRNANIPLENAQRNAELTDLQQLRPLQREAQTAQLQNLRAKQQFEAESLPILNDIKREAIKQEFEDVKQHGVPSATMAVFNKTVPGFAAYDQNKLIDPKTGQLNTVYALETIATAIQKADKLKQRDKFTGPVKQSKTDPSGKVTETVTVMDQLTGQPVGPEITTDVKEVNTAEVAAKETAAKASLSNDVLKERNSSDGIKRYIPQAGAFQAIDEIRYRGTPPKNSDDLAILYEFIKVLDPTSVVREGEKKFAESTAPGVQQLYNRIQGLWRDSNRTMDEGTRTNLYATIDTLRSGAEKQIVPELRRISEIAIDRGVPLSQAFTEPELRLLINGPSVPGRPAPGLPVTLNPPAGAPPANPALPGVTVTSGSIPTVNNAAEARALPSTVQFFLTPTGEQKKNPNYRP